MNNTQLNKQQQTERLQALLALAAQPPVSVGACPDDAILANFINGMLQDEAREHMLQHLHACPECYQQWQTVEACLSMAPPTSAPITARAESTWQQRLHAWWQQQTAPIWYGSLASAAATVLLAAWLLPQLLFSSSMDQQLDQLYQSLNTDHRPAVQQALVHFDNPLQRRSNQLGFLAQAESTPSNRAFSAGLWTGQQLLDQQERQQVPVRLQAPANTGDWTDSQWHAFYQLGRWTMALWIVSQFNYEMSMQYWENQKALCGELQTKLQQQANIVSEAGTVQPRLKTIAELLNYLPAPQTPQVYEQLGRELELLMQTLAAGV